LSRVSLVSTAMTQAIPSPAPRKLYEQLRAHQTRDARTQGALEFIVRSTKAAGGFLFFAQHGELEVVTGPREATPPPPDVFSEAQRVWARELDVQPEDLHTKTVDASSLQQLQSPREQLRWTSASGQRYGWQLLSVYRNLRWCPLGLAMLELQSDELTPLRQAYVESICNAFVDAADIVVAS
jgi:hypothetical protein